MAGGPFTSGQAAAQGISADVLRRLLLRGDVRRVLRGVYVDATTPDDLTTRAAAAALVVTPGAALARRTAAWIFGVDARAMGAHLVVPPVDVVVPEGGAAARRTGCSGYSAKLGTTDVIEVAGLPVTSPLRTTLDLLRVLERPDALAAADTMLHAGLVTRDELYDGLDRFRGFRGITQARELTELTEPATESAMESRTRLRVIDAGLPRPEVQINVYDVIGQLIARLDMGYLRRRKGIEFDGDEHHSSRADQAHDRRRRDRLEASGWDVLVVTREQVLGRSNVFELAVGELLGMAPRLRRRVW
jgi:very-short-patch-repair endonuclease